MFHMHVPTFIFRTDKPLNQQCDFSLFQAFRDWGAVRSKKERKKIKAREGVRGESLSPQSSSTFIAFFTLHRSPLSERLELASVI